MSWFSKNIFDHIHPAAAVSAVAGGVGIVLQTAGHAASNPAVMAMLPSGIGSVVRVLGIVNAVVPNAGAIIGAGALVAQAATPEIKRAAPAVAAAQLATDAVNHPATGGDAVQAAMTLSAGPLDGGI